MSSLERKAEALRKKIDQAASAGDKATMQKLQRELNSTKRVMDQLQGSALKVDDVLRRLDSATPKELNKALRQLKRELNGLERGTQAWDEHVRKIRAVRAELDNVNASLREQQSNWQRFNGWLNQCQTALLGLGAGLTGLTMAGRKAVQAYADMDQEMANVRKYADMSAEQVEALNEEFKKMDTRTSREELNRLAQQAGRLGKKAQEDIMGFVRAADQVNVALDDLGDDATLTLSKLTKVFGDEKRLGTEKALLSVGSVINELSQNCEASAPYLAEFSSRMGGVSSQANMAIQQVMAFGAVLDSNNQPLEASSTALSQLIVHLSQAPEKFAQVAGLNVQKFTELVRTDMNGAILELLETLGRAGGMETLAPMFKDMGEEGSRAISTLSSLAGHIEEVKSQQQVANQAFEEATSISKEFDVQNNTVQAGFDKARKGVTELAVELGQKLMPVASLMKSSMTIFLQVLSATVDFVAKYRKEIIVAISTITAYKVAVAYSNNMQRIYNAGVKTGTLIQTAYTAAVRIAQAALYTLTGNLSKASVAFKAFSQAIKANPIGLLVSAATALIGVFGTLASKYNDNIRKMREQREESERLKKECTDFAARATEAYSKEILKLQTLYDAATDEAKSREERIQAAKELQALYPDIFKKYSAEEIMLRKAENAYKDLTKAIIRKAEAQAAAELYKDNFKKILEYDIRIDQVQDQEKDARRELNKIEKRNEQRRSDMKKNKEAESLVGALVMNQTGGAGGTSQDGRGNMESTANARRSVEARQAEIKSLKNEKQIHQDANDLILSRFKDDKEFQKQIMDDGNADNQNAAVPYVPQGNDTGMGGGSGETVDKFAAEKEWREKQEALNTIAYRSGEKDYEEYTSRMDAIAVEFYDRQLKHTDLGETERLKIQAQYHEAVAKQDQNARKATLDTLEQEYAEQGRLLKQNYIDGLISKETYELKTQEAEMEHQRRLSQCMEIGEKERLAAQDKYNDLLISNREKTHQKWLESVKRLAKEMKEKQAELDKVKQEVFGLNQAERDAAYAADLAKLDSVYASEMKAAEGNAAEKLRIEKAYLEAVGKLREKYMQDPQTADGFRKSIEKTKEWLDSEGGKALTGSLGVVVSGMSSVFSQLTSSMQADLELQTAAISRRYDAEISRAEGNAYKVAQLEKRKEAEIAAAKNEANRKMFAMQVIQAVAQTAQNAISAYGSALQVGGLAGLILAPIAAAMAVAAGMLQVAAIKKQAQASEAQGYAEGGFTRPGRKDEPAGIVHAGEWVAPQALVRSPQTRPLIDALEQARLGNTRPAIRAMDVSRAVTAPMVLAAAAPQPGSTPLAARETTTSRDSDTGLQKTLSRLADRLERPFITVNSVTGETGMQKAQRDYDRLMANKSPKKR